jgi:hypothetical protein
MDVEGFSMTGGSGWWGETLIANRNTTGGPLLKYTVKLWNKQKTADSRHIQQTGDNMDGEGRNFLVFLLAIH